MHGHPYAHATVIVLQGRQEWPIDVVVKQVEAAAQVKNRFSCGNFQLRVVPIRDVDTIGRMLTEENMVSQIRYIFLSRLLFFGLCVGT